MRAEPEKSTGEHTSALLQIENLTVRIAHAAGAFDVIDNVSFEIGHNEIVCVIGESGSGKTVLMHSLLGLLRVQPGVIAGHIRVNFDGKAQDLLEGLSSYLKRSPDGRRVVKSEGWNRLYRQRTQHMLGHHLGLIFQNPRNALDPLIRTGNQVLESVVKRSPNLPSATARQQALDWLEKVKIHRPSEVFHLYPHQLSGGMCQRVAIAQILALHPSVIIADEPTTGLDATIQLEILDLMAEIQGEYRLSVILITHDFAVVERLAHRILVLFRGRLLEEGKAADLLATSAVLHPYTAELLRNVRLLENAAGATLRRVDWETIVQSDQPTEGLTGGPQATGCNFVGRCPVARSERYDSSRCLTEQPAMVELGLGHRIRCHYAEYLTPENV